MTGNKNAWRAPLAGLASLAMIATMGVAAGTANAVSFDPETESNNGSPVYDVTFDLNGQGSWKSDQYKKPVALMDKDDQYKLTEAEQNDAKDAINAPSNYVFAGWWTSPEIGQGEQINPDAATTKDLTLYAHWAKQGDTKTVSFENPVNPTTGEALAELPGGTSIELANGDRLSAWQKPVDSVVDGYLVSSDTWSKYGVNNAATVSLDAPVTESLTLYPTYVEGHTVRYYGLDNGWKFANGTDWEYEVADGAALPQPVVVKGDDASGYVQITGGWANRSDGKDVDLSSVKSDLELVAKKDFQGAPITTQAYRVAFQVNDLAGENPAPTVYPFSAPEEQYVLAGKSVDVAAAEKQLNLYDGMYKVSSWKFNNKAYSNQFVNYTGQTTDVFMANNGNATTLHATLALAQAPSVEYAITFDPNYTGAKTTTVKVKKGESIQAAAPADPSREGYKFLGWFLTVAAGNTTDRLDQYDVATAKVTYKAMWQRTNQYELDALLGIVNTEVVSEGGESYTLYTPASYDAYERVRAQVAKDSEGAIVKNNDGTYTAHYSDVTLTDEEINEYIETLTAAKAKLVYTPQIKNAYVDVDAQTPHAEDIYALTATGVIRGYADNTFRGASKIKRQDFAAFLYRLAGEPEFDVKDATKTFTDVNEATPHYKEILWAAKEGIIKGFADGTFRGMNTVVRQDAAAFLYRLTKSTYNETDADKAGVFSDVTAGDNANHATEVLWAAKEGIVRGFTDGTFRGMDDIIRQDAAAFLNRADKAMDIPSLYK